MSRMLRNMSIRYLCLFIFCLLNIYIPVVSSSAGISKSINELISVESFSINPNGLSVTSFYFNPTRQRSAWVDHMLGSQSVQYNYSQPRELIAYHPILPEGIFDQKLINRIAHCSFDILGFGVVKNAKPLHQEYRYRKPSSGFASMKLILPNFANDGVIVECYYRASYENYRADAYNTQNFWPVMFYCPVPSRTMCEHIIQTSMNTIRAQDSGKGEYIYIYILHLCTYTLLKYY
jgi:hypothetical protein